MTSSHHESQPTKTVVIMAGGTGGHVFPALAVAHALKGQGNHCHWMGTDQGIESRLVPENGFPLHRIRVKGFRGKGLLTKLQLPIQLLQAVLQAMGIFKRLKPRLVVGFGGFASGPGGLAAKILGIPLVIHEQNAIAGTTNRWLSKVANQNLSAFPSALPNSEWVGNPIRAEIVQLATRERPVKPETDTLNLLILGGSLGALAINHAVPKALALLKEKHKDRHRLVTSIQVRHQCGPKHLDVTQTAYQDAQLDHNTYRVEPFISDMANAYQWADLVICRSGALTVSELAAAGCASLLIPFPHAIDDHQTHNALWLVNEQAALLMPQSQLSAEALAAQLNQLLAKPEQLHTMTQAAHNVAISNATDKVVQYCQTYL